MKSAFAAALLVTMTPELLPAQQPESFEVISIRPTAPGTRVTSKLDRAQFHGTAHTLAMLLMSAYPDLPGERISGGPAWIREDSWDFTAKLPPGMPADDEKLYRRTEAMLQAFLAERFKLQVHWEMREQSTYALVVAKTMPKLKVSETGPPSFQIHDGRIEFGHRSMGEFALFLSPQSPNSPTDRPVLDQTGLHGFYDFTLDWGFGDGSSIFPAVAQLGLRLEPRKAPVPYLVVDHAEKPAEN